MRLRALLCLPLLLPALAPAKWTDEQKIDILRGLSSEFATAKVPLPRSKKALEVDTKGNYDKAKWTESGKELGPAARLGDLIKITKVDFDDDRLVLEINDGMKSKRKWYERVEVGMGSRTSPIGGQQATAAPAGTTLALRFEKASPPLSASEVKKMLSPILDFEKRSATESYVEKLAPEVQQAIKDQKAIEGMDREQVLLAMGRPVRKVRDIKDGAELEDWIYGQAPGRITFVTFNGSKVQKVKEAYAGLGGSTAPTLKPQ